MSEVTVERLRFFAPIGLLLSPRILSSPEETVT
jgi:hypothetical protein